ncbi:MAG: Sec-independent protein translocase protein TatB [Acidiferrobacteraceae bacterium]|jgi:sec-independent protein translocase protein TatB
MFDVGFSELTLIGLLALIVLGPKRLPEAARTAGLWVGRLRAFISNVRDDLDRELQGGDLEELRKLKHELDETRRMVRQQSSETFSQLQALDEAITGDHSILPSAETPAQKPRAKTRKKAAKKSTRKKSATKKTTRPAKKKAKRSITKKK